VLIGSKANVEADDNANQRPLFMAAFAGHVDICRLLIESKAIINVKHNPGGWGPSVNGGTTPLHEAAARGYVEVCELLIASGADVNRRDKDGYTPMICAISKYSNYSNMAIQKIAAVCQLLILSGANVNSRDKAYASKRIVFFIFARLHMLS